MVNFLFSQPWAIYQKYKLALVYNVCVGMKAYKLSISSISIQSVNKNSTHINIYKYKICYKGPAMIGEQQMVTSNEIMYKRLYAQKNYINSWLI